MVSPRTWIKQTDYPELAFRSSLGAFTTQRAELLAVLSYVERLVVHERSHIKQIATIVNTIHS